MTFTSFDDWCYLKEKKIEKEHWNQAHRIGSMNVILSVIVKFIRWNIMNIENLQTLFMETSISQTSLRVLGIWSSLVHEWKIYSIE